MNTMADGAAQRLVAQIGEDLFGQPGLTLMELTEKVRGDDGYPMVLVSQEFKSQADYDAEISSAIANMLRRNNLGLTGSAPEMVEKLLILAAQPSPAGQGDARRQWLEVRGLAAGIVKNLRAFADSPHKAAWCGALDDALSFAETIEKDADAAYASELAARRPVGEPVAWLIERLRGKGYGRDKYVVMKGQASSDPDSHLFWTDQQARDNHRVTPLYVSPAQAVDLVDFKALYRAYVRLLESGMDRIRDLGGSCDPVDVMEANDVDLQAARRVIDSKAVGK